MPFEIFPKTEWKDFPYLKPAAKRGGNLTTKHMCIASRYKHLVVLIGKPTGKMFPPFYVLNLIEKDKRFCVIQFTISIQNIL